jgi:hypothetical protein
MLCAGVLAAKHTGFCAEVYPAQKGPVSKSDREAKHNGDRKTKEAMLESAVQVSLGARETSGRGVRKETLRMGSSLPLRLGVIRHGCL